ncbi:ubiquinol-cytochrome C chaperone family protein [Terricaulis sp.]|uniref:ubiquinol-cytochrome C chaperone family protein n=1 Tax=Terricaulis sp. TaxID=2768686 RepID=UPI00378381AC
MASLGKLWPFRRSRADEDAERLLSTVTAVSRQPGFYGAGRVPDTLEGRFELLTLHAVLALVRLKASPEAAPLAQSFTDRLFRQFDAGLREDGVGDLTVPKKVRKLAGDFYGRLHAYAAALEGEDASGLQLAIERNIVGEGAAFAAALAGYASEVTKRQAAGSLDSLFRLDGWGSAPV